MSGTKPIEDQLRDLIAAGELEEAIELMLKEYGGAVATQILYVIKDRELAKDVYQQTFIAAHRDLPRFDGRSKIKTWLLAIAHHRAIDCVRKLRREDKRNVSEEVLSTMADDSAPTPEQLVDSPRILRALEECMDKLSEEARVAVLQRFKEGRSYEDMARETGERSGTWHARATRAMPVLRACIEGKGFSL